MKMSQQSVYHAPAVADGVVEFRNDGSTPPTVWVENLDGASSSAIKYQESANGVTWSDIAGTNATVNPGDSDKQSIVSVQPRLRLHAGGDVDLSVTVDRQVNGSPVDLGPMI
jgi:hypothetical protein